jgi:hypothetical protein
MQQNNWEVGTNYSYIEKFFVGLLEGDGMIVVNLDKRNSDQYFLRYRFMIALLSIEANLEMLNLIQQRFGGKVNIERQGRYVVWTVSSYNLVVDLVAFFDKYPLLTFRKRCQLSFLKGCMAAGKEGPLYFEKFKGTKYCDQAVIGVCQNSVKVNTDYFGAWLSGFIEAEGCFTKRKNSRGKKYTYCFSIGQNNDAYVLEAIKTYLGSTNKISLRRNTSYYAIDMYGPQVRNNLVSHFQKYPLLGAKQNSFLSWLAGL